ncbi:FecR family protein [Cellulophaga fucicola]|uniref:FecR family protein n=1 Tax=Cellulophaga fucicola TaxID=76595 RepID=UPI003EB898D0
MITPEIESIIIKYINKSANTIELNILTKWIKDENNVLIFKTYVETHYAINYSTSKSYKSEIELNKKMKIEIKKSKKITYTKKVKTLFKYAALILFFIGLGFSIIKYKNSSTISEFTDNDIILQLENGEVQIIKGNISTEVKDAQGNTVGNQTGNQLVYTDQFKTEKLSYNTLTVPYGKRFKIQLSDGTSVHLNSGTSIKYPVQFIKGKKRKVFLNGEAFFDVKKDKEHPFIVNINNMNVRVLGTKFNVSSYPEDANVNTVLVEGSVGIYKKEDLYNPETAAILKPGYKGTWNKNDRKININKADIEMYTSWINGRILFRHTTFNNIIKKLERHYNIKISNNNIELGKQYFAASFDEETIDQVLKTFNETYSFKYTIINNQIIIN